MTDAELTLLSLLTDGPRYGHELQHMIDSRGLREWVTIGFSSIYYLLNRLEKQHFVTSEQRSINMSARKRYRLTEAGRGVLQTAIANLLREPRTLGSGFELGLANLKALKPAQVYRVLSDHQHDLKHQYLLVEQAWAHHQAEHNFEDQVNIHALYTHSLALMQAELTWLENFLNDWKNRYPNVEAERAVEAATPSSAATVLSRSPTPDPLKMIQRLKSVPKVDATQAEDEAGGNGDNA